MWQPNTWNLIEYSICRRNLLRCHCHWRCWRRCWLIMMTIMMTIAHTIEIKTTFGATMLQPLHMCKCLYIYLYIYTCICVGVIALTSAAPLDFVAITLTSISLLPPLVQSLLSTRIANLLAWQIVWDLSLIAVAMSFSWCYYPNFERSNNSDTKPQAACAALNSERYKRKKATKC